MSRIGRLPVAIPNGVKVSVAGSTITVEGPKGKLVREFDPGVAIAVDKDGARVERKDESKQGNAYHGLYRKLLANMVTGVSTGFTKSLIINGVGYRAEVKGKSLVLSLGYSIPIEYMFDSEITITVDQGTKIVISGADREKVGQVSAEIRKLRLPEPYKGKGIRYDNETIRRKVGKSGVK